MPTRGLNCMPMPCATGIEPMDSTPWVLLRGLTREAGHWGQFAMDFGAAFPCAAVILLDLPGNGALNHQRSPSSVAEIARHCRTQLHERGVQGPVNLLAMSLGAMVAIDWMTTAPEEVASSVLVNTSVRPFSPMFHRLRPRNYLSLLAMALGATKGLAIEATILRITSHLVRADEAQALQHIQAWTLLRKLHPVHRMNALRQLLAAARFTAVGPAPSCPVLLLASECDGLVNPACSRALHRSWHCQLNIHPLAGHDLPLDAPAWVIQKISAFMAQRNNA